MSKIFQNIAGYFPLVELNRKEVLTVGSSIDQAFNAILFGANRVVLYDINPYTADYLRMKRDLILGTKREELYQRIIQIDQLPKTEELFSWQDLQNMNPYLHDDEAYHYLQALLQDTEIEFVAGDIFQMDKSLSDEKFDCMVFSNILQYMSFFAGFQGISEEKLLRESFEKWISFLKEDGILQLIYYYGVNNNLADYINKSNILSEYVLYLLSFPDFQNVGEDGIVIYKKTRRY